MQFVPIKIYEFCKLKRDADVIADGSTPRSQRQHARAAVSSEPTPRRHVARGGGGFPRGSTRAGAHDVLSRWQGGPSHRRPHAGTCGRDVGAEPRPTGRRGHVAASQMRGARQLAAQARMARFARRFWRSNHRGVRFSLQKHTTAHITLGLAPVLAPGARFISGFHYRSVEDGDTDARGSVACL